ncbi:Transcription factor WEREWOLF [Entamoeba marina]
MSERESSFVQCSVSPSTDSERYNKRPRKQGKSWTHEEDERLLKAVEFIGDSNWVEIAKFVNTRSRKQCRERFINHVSPTIDRREWTKEEDDIILGMYQLVGGKWCQINKKLVGRTARAVRNRYKSLMNKTDMCKSCFCSVSRTEYVVCSGGYLW